VILLFDENFQMAPPLFLLTKHGQLGGNFQLIFQTNLCCKKSPHYSMNCFLLVAPHPSTSSSPPKNTLSVTDMASSTPQFAGVSEKAISG